MNKKDSPMNTSVSDSLSHFEEEETDVTIVHYVSVRNLERPVIRFLRPILKWFGLLSAIAWGAAALSPATFRVPVSLQGWVFTIAILWFFGFCAGLFNL
jgi:hypothetical protein